MIGKYFGIKVEVVLLFVELGIFDVDSFTWKISELQENSDISDSHCCLFSDDQTLESFRKLFIKNIGCIK